MLPAYARRKLCVLMRNKPRLAALVEEVDLNDLLYCDFIDMISILSQGGRLPSLQSLKNIPWDQHLAAKLPAPLLIPALRSISVDGQPNVRLSTYFDLTASLSFGLHQTWANSFDPACLAELPSTITRLSLRGFSLTKFGLVVPALHRFIDTLTDLTLVPRPEAATSSL